MWEFILYSILFGLTAVSVYILINNQLTQIQNQRAMINLLLAIKKKV